MFEYFLCNMMVILVSSQCVNYLAYNYTNFPSPLQRVVIYREDMVGTTSCKSYIIHLSTCTSAMCMIYQNTNSLTIAENRWIGNINVNRPLLTHSTCSSCPLHQTYRASLLEHSFAVPVPTYVGGWCLKSFSGKFGKDDMAILSGKI